MISGSRPQRTRNFPAFSACSRPFRGQFAFIIAVSTWLSVGVAEKIGNHEFEEGLLLCALLRKSQTSLKPSQKDDFLAGNLLRFLRERHLTAKTEQFTANK